MSSLTRSGGCRSPSGAFVCNISIGVATPFLLSVGALENQRYLAADAAFAREAAGIWRSTRKRDRRAIVMALRVRGESARPAVRAKRGSKGVHENIAACVYFHCHPIRLFKNDVEQQKCVKLSLCEVLHLTSNVSSSVVSLSC